MANHRFVLDPEDYVVDTFNSHPRVPHWAVYDTSEKSLRESVVIRRVKEFVDKLLVNNQPFVEGPWGEPYQPSNPENFSLTLAIYYAVKASHLNSRDVASSLKNKFDGKLLPDDVGWQHTTSISLFLRDVESLLRDLYGNFDDDVIELTRQAIFIIVQEFLRFARNDLCLEHESAVDIDNYFEPSKLLDIGICPDDINKAANKATLFLFDRVRTFRANPDAFSQYTAIFLKSYNSPLVSILGRVRSRDGRKRNLLDWSTGAKC